METTDTQGPALTCAPPRILISVDPALWKCVRLQGIEEGRPVWRLVDQALREYLGARGGAA